MQFLTGYNEVGQEEKTESKWSANQVHANTADNGSKLLHSHAPHYSTTNTLKLSTIGRQIVDGIVGKYDMFTDSLEGKNNRKVI